MIVRLFRLMRVAATLRRTGALGPVLDAMDLKGWRRTLALGVTTPIWILRAARRSEPAPRQPRRQRAGAVLREIRPGAFDAARRRRQKAGEGLAAPAG